MKWIACLAAMLLWSASGTLAFAQTDENQPDENEEATDAAETADEGAEETTDDAAEADAAEAPDAEPAEAVETEPAETTDPNLELEEGASAEPSEEASSQLAAPEVDESAEEGAEEATEEAAEEAEEAEEDSGPAPLPWRSSFFTWTNQATFNSFVRDGQLSYDPTYQQSFSLSPRWYVAPMTFFWANVSLNLEITDTNFNALNRDPQITDPVVEIRHMIPWEGFIFIAQGRLGLPVSKASQAAQRYLQTGLGTTIVRVVPEINLTIAGLFAYRRWWAGSNVTLVDTPQPDTCGGSLHAPAGGGAPEAPTVFCGQLGDATAARDIILAGVSLTMTPFGGFSINASAFLFNTYNFELANAEIGSDQIETRPDGDPLVIPDQSRTHWRNFTYFAVSVAYQFLPWLNVSLGVQNSGFLASAYNPDGSIRNPLVTPDTQVFLGATIGLDTLYTDVFVGAEDNLTPEERQRRQQGLASGPSTGGSF
ncbi:MAG TPA: hypothetical protein DEF51_47555 [Myxococcales bacterium]|nr:hypothetical protein [Myxococcales bacterium]